MSGKDPNCAQAMTDPIFMSASYQPSEYIRAQEAAGKTMPARPGLFGSEGFTFGDFLDVINPLQHIPIVSTIYRAVTGDTIKPGSRIAGDTLFGGPIGLAAGVIDAMVQESTGKDIGEQAMAAVGIDIGPDKTSPGGTAVADGSKPAPEPQPQPGAGDASVEAQAAQATIQQAAGQPAVQAGAAQPDLKMSVGRAVAQAKPRWAGAASEPKQQEVAPDDPVSAATVDRQRMAQELAEQQEASRRALEQMMTAQNQPAQNPQLPAAQAAQARAQPAAVSQVDSTGRVWFPAFPRGGNVPTRAVGAQPITQQAVAAKFGTAKSALPPSVSAPVVSPVAVAPNTDDSIPSAAVDNWAERAAAGYQKYFDMQRQTDRTRTINQYQ